MWEKDSVAVVGISARFPGAPDHRRFWTLLADGVDATGPLDDCQWGLTGTSSSGNAWRGGSLPPESIGAFDSDFFSISPREAAAMDPQQRLALELAWEAVEDAGIRPGELNGTDTAVYVGATADDWAGVARSVGAAPDRYTLAGRSRSLIANRISYLLKTRGASLAVDTGQSSSLTAVHLAANSIRNSASEMALVGGIQLNLAAESTLAAEQFGGLSADGRCFTFDARANGYVRGEGGAFVVLQDLAKAKAQGRRIYAIVRGSAVGNDGGGAGLTAPNFEGQVSVLELAYRDAGIDPQTVDYVELHGTGTAVGDPIEARALGATVGAASGRTAPVRVGSVKTNIGHLEGAAGIAGFVKTVLAVHNRYLPPSLNFETVNPRIDLEGERLTVQTVGEVWPDDAGSPPIAGVSSFGMGGSNCHVVVTGHPVPIVKSESVPRLVPVILSARTPAALRSMASNLADWIEGAGSTPDAGLTSVAYSAAVGRHAWPIRLAVSADSAVELTETLRNFGRGQISPAVVSRASERPHVSTAFLFAGQGSQRPEAGLELYRRFPAYACAYDEVCAHLDNHLDRPLTSIAFAEAGSSAAELLDRTEYTQPAVFAAEVASYRLLESWGIVPDMLLGHSIGEIAAAHLAGVFDLADASRLAALRGSLMGVLPEGGSMLSVELPVNDVMDILATLAESLRPDIAAINGPAATVVAGSDDSVAAFRDAVGAARTKPLAVSHAFHSSLMEPMVAELESVLATITFHPPVIPLISATTGRDASTRMSTPEYWADQVRSTVRFAEGVASLHRAGVRRFVELGPTSTLAISAGRTVAELGGDPSVLVSLLRRGRGEVDTAFEALGTLFVEGLEPDWRRVLDDGTGSFLSLPTYPFERSRHWLDDGPSERAMEPASLSATEFRTPAASEPSTSEPVAPQPSPVERGMEEVVRTHVTRVLRHRTPVDIERTFESLGADSLALVEILSSISAEVGATLPETLLFDHPTPASLAEFLAGSEGATSGTRAIRPVAVDAGEPIAIVGMGCRLPGGVSSPEALWQLLIDETDAIGEFPKDRGWALDSLFDDDADVPRKSFVDSGGFVIDAHAFDPAFFGISAREALAMDPQQRVILETTWHALEHARIKPSSLSGANAGVFTGIMPQDYGPRMHRADPDSEGYLLTGTTTSVGSGRIAYTLGLEGPAISVDTACSSSLVATHMAVRSLRSGEVDLAVAGGVTIIANPGIFVELTRQRALSPRGRCRAFSDDADGTGWAEGAAVLVLQRLSDAEREGREILAVIRGSAINQDGSSNGLTAPNGLAQGAVIAAALADADLSLEDVDAVEAHGTGTRLGDPVEANALVQAFASRTADANPLWLGSLKSNIGHTQAAAGAAGVIKAVLALRHERLPRTLHVEEPTSRVDWSSTPLTVLTESVPWAKSARMRRIGVSSFGISGTNSHLIVEEAPKTLEPPTVAVATPPSVVPFVLSARDADALARTADRLSSTVSSANFHSIGRSLSGTRDALDVRAVVLAVPGDVAGTVSSLQTLTAGDESAAVITGKRTRRESPVFVFPGQGSQWEAMAAAMYREFPVFAEALDTMDAAIAEFAGWHVVDVLLGREDSPDLERIDVVQPVLFAMMSALARWWQSLGVEPAAVVGHSQGEIAAAYIAGILDLEDAAHIVVARSRAWLRLRGQGAMLSVMASGAQVLGELGPWQERIGIAAVNSPLSVAVSGDIEALDALSAVLSAKGIENKIIPGVDVAGHSPQVELFETEFDVELAAIEPRVGSIPFYSTVTAASAVGDTLDAHYWYENMRRTVEFEKTTTALMADGHRAFLECSPHPLLASSLASTSEANEADVLVLHTLRRGKGDRSFAVSAAARAWVAGVDVEWEAMHIDAPIVDLPLYPFERRALWLPEDAAGIADVAALGIALPEHPLLTTITVTPGRGGVVATGRIDERFVAVLPIDAGLCVDIVSSVADELGAFDIAELTMIASVTADSGAVGLGVEITPSADGAGYGFTMHARTDETDSAGWVSIAEGTLVAAPLEEPDFGPADPAGIRVDVNESRVEEGFPVDPGFVARVAAAAHRAGLSETAWVSGIDGYRVYATGATTLSVEMRPVTDGIAVLARENDGRPVLSIDTLRSGVEQIGSSRGDSVCVLDVRWNEIAFPEAESSVPERILYVQNAEDSDSTELVAQVIRTVSEWISDDRNTGSIAVVTDSACSVDESEAARIQPAHAAVAGALRSMQTENPGRINVIDRCGPVTEELVTAAAGVGSGAIRGERLYVPGASPLVLHSNAPDADAVARAVDRDGTVLITGGTGTLGATIARHLVQARGIRHLVLLSRRGADAANAPELQRELTELGAVVRIEAVDAADRTALSRVLDTIDEHPLVGVVHAAGRLDDGVASALDIRRVGAVMEPKATAAQHLLQLTDAFDLEFLVFFSSMVASLGNPGQANYAAANSYLDASAVRARAHGRPVFSIGWGLWANKSGMSEHLSDVDLDRMRSSGVLPLATERGLEMFDAILRSTRAATLAVELDPEALTRRVDDPGFPPMLRGLVPRRRRTVENAPEAATDPTAEFADMLPQARAHAVEDAVRIEIARVLGDDAELTVDTQLKEAGFDSLMTLELRNRLSRRTGLSLPGTVVFDHPTTAALSAYLLSRLGGAVERTAEATDNPDTTAQADNTGRTENTPGTDNIALDGAPDAGADDPVVIVSMACRLPGGINEPEQLWDLLDAGGSAIGPLPTDRGWRTDLFDPDRRRPGTSATDRGGFLYDAAEFDAQFFSISPREAAAMDPQQRLLLEAAWEVLERAGIDPRSVRGESVGVYIGSVGQDYLGADDTLPEQVEGFAITGKASSVASGRISYFLGLEGPSMTVDTACSSSLVALHLAAKALRGGECSSALVGGVSIMSRPGLFVEFSRQQGLAADGTCKSFGAGADGTGWAEGVTMVMVERQSEALRRGHCILGTIDGSAVNQDGASNGLTAPSGRAQQRVIAAALRDAGVKAADIDLVEAHGTGTKLGDPIEAEALIGAYGTGRTPVTPVWLGSLKSNIGHTQGSAGIAGIIKILLSLAHERMPATLGAQPPTPHVDWSAGTVALLDSSREWPVSTRVRRAGISAFGISGTNAHMIISEPRSRESIVAEHISVSPQPNALLDTDRVVWPISASSHRSLTLQASKLASSAAVTAADADLHAIAAALSTTRAQLEHRAVISSDTVGGAVQGLAELATTGRAVPGRTAFVFAGQGSQWVGMGSELYLRSSVFADAFDEVCSYVNAELDIDLKGLVFGDVAGGIDDTAIAQPALFAIEVAMARLLTAAGVNPDYLVGHSIGEIAAAHIGGVLSLPDACRLVVARGSAMSALPAGGGMVAVAAPAATVRSAMAGREDVGLAAVNSATACVISGNIDRLREIADSLTSAGIQCRELRVSHAFHSPLMKPVRGILEDVASRCTFGSRTIEIVSTVTGTPIDDEFADPDYWAEHAVAEVRFADAIAELGRRGVTRVVEIGPDSALVAAVRDTLGLDMSERTIGTMRRGQNQVDSVLAALTTVWLHGGHVDWTRLLPVGVTPVSLPTYAFDRSRYWLEQAPVARSSSGPSAALFEAETLQSLCASLGIGDDVSAAELFSALRGGDASARWRYRSTFARLAVGERRQEGPVCWVVLVPLTCKRSVEVEALLHDITTSMTSAHHQLRTLRVDTAADDQVERTIDELSADPNAALVSLLAYDDDEDADLSGLSRGTVATLAVARAMMRRDVPIPLWLITSDGTGSALTHAGIWGLARVLGLEQPKALAGIVDLPADPAASTVSPILTDLLRRRPFGDTVHGEYEYRIDSEGVAVHRLQQVVDTPDSAVAAGSWTPRGRVLITGGTGGLGAEVARWAASNHAELILLSRGGVNAPGAAQLLAELSTDTDVQIISCDVADKDRVTQVVADVEAAGGPITAVVHAAGTVGSTPISELGSVELIAHARGKVRGAANLDVVFAGRDLDAFVLFASVAGVWGSGGHGAYATANACLDGLARRRAARGDTATSVSWGPWEGAGMITGDGVENHLRTRGLEPMAAAAAIRELARAVGRREDVCTVVADIDWSRFAELMSTEHPRPQFDSILTASTDAADVALDVGAAFEEDLRARPSEDRVRVVVDIIRQHAADVLGFGSVDDVPGDRAFRDAGFDSLMAVELRDRITRDTGIAVTAVMIFDHPTPGELAAALVAARFGSDTASAPSDEQTTPELDEAEADDVFAYIDSMLEVPR